MKTGACLLAALWLAAAAAGAEVAADPALLAAIQAIPAIDNHAHPLAMVAAGGPPDQDYDALTFEELGEFPLPLRIRPDNREWPAIWRTLWQYPHADASDEHVAAVIAAKERAQKDKGAGYPAWVLDQLRIETMIANRAAMGPGLTAPRFRWVSMIDPLLFPLDNTALLAQSPDHAAFFKGEIRLRDRYFRESGVSTPPARLDDYVERVVLPTLARHKQEGALGVKFESAYLRGLDFAPADPGDARRVYEKYAAGGTPPGAEYKTLQDHLFRRIAAEAGRLGLAVHLHTGVGAGSFFDIGGSNPMRLESAFNDPALRKTSFVMLHAGWPFTREAGALLMKANVYADFSVQTILHYPAEVARFLRPWLEWFPDKVLFGTDAEPFTPVVSWEETGWMSADSARRALAIALTGMIEDGEVTREQALAIARGVLRENARKLYGLGGPEK